MGTALIQKFRNKAEIAIGQWATIASSLLHYVVPLADALPPAAMPQRIHVLIAFLINNYTVLLTDAMTGASNRSFA
ncbi:hypothetical protein [Paenibacillus alvei]|uniref:hypothetical protein n=1 Tax=Paenibacillus alvei TaxID=44250 RepID=UPI0018CFBF87|nr:hypothetical protein [Paenibacillus alvei]MCY9579011.1 hypothetical protein [Paenibacillus alvei]